MMSLALVVFNMVESRVAGSPADWRQRLGALTVGQRLADGQPWQLRLIDGHLLVAGTTGAGKGSLLWSIVLGLAPSVVAGVVELWALDPKRMELSLGRGCFARYAATADDMVALLEEAVATMLERADRLSGVTRRFEPTDGTPLVVLFVDELGYLSSLLPDRDLKKRADQALTTLLALGRSVGFTVVGAIQDPRKETLSNRDLFPTRVAMRLPAEMVNLVLSREAYQDGARCDQIAPGPAGAGMAYVYDETTAAVTLVRAYWISDELIQDWEPWLEWAGTATPEERLAAAAGILKHRDRPSGFAVELERLGEQLKRARS